MKKSRQPALKPQDLVVTMALAIHHGHRSFAELASRLHMSTSEVHAATERAELSRLVARVAGQPTAIASALQEFLIHGLKYAFPPLIGATTRGVATGAGAEPLRKHFAEMGDSAFVWPDAEGQARGASLQPLYPSVPQAARLDPDLYAMLVLVDGIRAGAARERELATKELLSRLR
jgi:hypothetical protein